MDIEKVVHHIAGEILEGRDGTFHAYKQVIPLTGYLVGGQSWTLTVTPQNFDGEIVRDFISSCMRVCSVSRTFM